VTTWSLRVLAAGAVLVGATAWGATGALAVPRKAVLGASGVATVPTPAPQSASGADDSGQPLFRLEGKRLTEVSGVAVDSGNDLFYMNQDAGNTDDVFTVDLTGRLRAIVHVPSANVDWEDIAIRPGEGRRGTLYLADTGDAYFTNRAKGLKSRTAYAIVKLDVPPVGRAGSTLTVKATGVVRYPFVFADKATHNAESLLVHPGTGLVLVADKTQTTREPAYLWQGPMTMSATSTNTFQKVGQLPIVGASGGAFSPRGDRFVIRNGTTAYLWRVTGTDMATALTHRPVVIPLPAQRQGEGVSFTPDGRSLVLTSEGGNSLVWQVDLPPEAQASDVDSDAVPQANLAKDRRLDQKALTVTALTVGGLLVLAGGRLLRQRMMR
jgi:hypothetical protein